EAEAVSYTLPKEFSVIVISVRNASFLSILGKTRDVFLKKNIAYYLGKGTEIVGIVDSDLQRDSASKSLELKEEILIMLSHEEQPAVVRSEVRHVVRERH